MIFAVIIASAVSCDKVEQEYIPEYDASEAVCQVITAKPAGAKTSVDPDWNTYWQPKDSLSVFVTRSSSSKMYFGHSAFASNGNGTFSGTVDGKFTNPFNWLAIYPYASYSSTMKSISLSLYHPTVQNQTGNNNNSHISGNTDPMWGFALGTESNPVITMHHISSVLAFHITNKTDSPIIVTGVTFTSPVAIAGEFGATIDIRKNYTGAAPGWKASSNAVNAVELRVSDADEIPAGQSADFFAAIHPVTQSGTYTIEVTATSGKKSLVFTKTIDTNFSLTAGKRKDVFVNFQNPEEVKFNDIENKGLKAYLNKLEAAPYFTSDAFVNWSTSTYSYTLMTKDIYGSNSSSNRLDQPAPVKIISCSKATSVEVYSDSGCSNMFCSSSFAASDTVLVYNLVPGRTYWYKVKNSGQVIESGTVVPEGRRRMLKVSKTYNKDYASNCRDFGGLKTVDGKIVRYGLIYRGTNIDGILKDTDALDVFVNLMGVKLDVDLRNTGEKGSSPDLGKCGIGRTPQNYDYRNHADNLQNAEKVRGTLDSVMTYVLEDKPVYLHCSIGSDRTGYFSMLIESLIGVCQNWTDTDYELTSFASSITYDARLRTETNDSGGQYKTGLDFLSQFNGVTLHDKAYDYVVTSSSGLKMDKTKVDSFIEKMKE